ncbi:SLAM family member 5-like [Megalops cyprinoides]|uniref:SLAM family member 5-like n=1 Tax=Megalops cyprinoides TaxID=118141 RepID=UPI001863ECA5|nr:SLAM family member 5-like [Megalops cyprinoides]
MDSRALGYCESVLFVCAWTLAVCFTKPTRCAGVRSRSVVEGESVTLHSHLSELQTNSELSWTFKTGSSFAPIAQHFRGEITTGYTERFKDRLQVDRQTGSLTISNLNTNDSGVYQLLMRHYNRTLSKFLVQLKVYTPASTPVISNITQSHSVSKSCSVLCSVENGREVTLSWQRGGETLNHTSSPDLNTNLSLPLEIEEYNSTYSCVAANPVHHSLTKLSMTELCPHLLHPQHQSINLY